MTVDEQIKAAIDRLDVGRPGYAAERHRIALAILRALVADELDACSYIGIDVNRSSVDDLLAGRGDHPVPTRWVLLSVCVAADLVDPALGVIADDPSDTVARDQRERFALLELDIQPGQTAEKDPL